MERRRPDGTVRQHGYDTGNALVGLPVARWVVPMPLLRTSNKVTLIEQIRPKETERQPRRLSYVSAETFKGNLTC